MSEIKVNKISPRAACGTTTLGDSGDTFTIPSGVTITNNGTANGFGATGAVNWQTGSIKTTTFTAVSGEGFFADTSSGGFTMNLPAGSAGNIVAVVDYTNTFQTGNLTISPNGSQKIGGINADATLSTQGQSVTFVYVDDTEGWKNINDSTSNVTGRSFISATGGTTADCGNFRTHTFTSPGTFNVTVAATCAANNVVDYFVVAGGGGSGGGSNDGGGGGGAGGFRLSNDHCMPAPLTSPLANPSGVTVSAQPYPITVGGGGAGASSYLGGAKGSDSVFDSITSAGGGVNSPAAGGASPNPGEGGSAAAAVGGAGGGTAANPGNQPPVSPPQGNNSGTSGGTSPNNQAGGGGGAGAVGSNAAPGSGGQGGIGSYVVQAGFAGCNGTTGPVSGARYFAAGGAGGGRMNGGAAQTSGGGGQGSSGDCGPSQAATSGTTNTGSGGGGGAPKGAGGSGGSGIVILRYKFQ